METSGLDHEDMPQGVRHISLIGRLDMTGIEAVEEPFLALTKEANLRILVDLRRASFLASVGIRSVINLARRLNQNGGKMALLLGDNQQVRDTLEITGITAAIPSFSTLDEALTKLTTA